jgi:hypothetical protein
VKIKTLEDIQKLVEGQIEEGLTVEYKKKMDKNEDIAKEVCAFANTEGGHLLYGVESRDRIPVGLSWIEGENVEERIQNVIGTYLQPKVEGVKVSRYANPNNAKQAVFVLEVPKSFQMPHMCNHRYYKRVGSISSPMDHNEVKNALLGPGRGTALRFEISANQELLSKTVNLIEQVTMNILPKKRHQILLVPFHADAWNAIVASGALFGFSESMIKQMVEAYAIIHEINSLIDWLKLGKELNVHTPVSEDSRREAGGYVPHIIETQLKNLRALLSDISKNLRDTIESQR